MAFSLETDTVIEAIRTTVGTSVTVGTDTVPIRSRPESDLWSLPTTGKFPMLAIEVTGDESPGNTDRDLVKKQAIWITCALHCIARNADIEAATSITTPAKFARQFAEAVSEKLAASPTLGTEIIYEARYEGKGADLEARPSLQEQGLTEFTCVWSWLYESDRP